MIEDEVRAAVNWAANTWLDETGLDEDELSQYDLWTEFSEPLYDDGELPGRTAWVRGTTEDYNLADFKIMRAVNYLLDHEDPQTDAPVFFSETYDGYFMQVATSLLPLASDQFTYELGDVIDLSL